MIKEKLKILFISPLPPPAGGIATWTQLFTSWLKDNKYSYKVINTALTGLRSENINNKRNIADEIKRTLNLLNNLKNQINSFSPNIIHLNTPCGKLGIIRDYIFARIIKAKGIKLVVHYHCNIQDQVSSSGLSLVFLRKISSLADINIVLNSYSKQYLFKETNISSIILPNFVDESFLIQEKKNIKGKIKEATFVGHFKPTKGSREIIKLATELPHINFNIIGPVPIDLEETNFPFNLSLRGVLPRQEVRKRLKESDIFLFPTHTEGFSNALLEAMSLGLPVLTTPVGANVDMIESKGGCLAEVGNVEEMKKAIELLDTAKIRSEMSKWNLNKVKNEYVVDKVSKNLVNYYVYLVSHGKNTFK